MEAGDYVTRAPVTRHSSQARTPYSSRVYPYPPPLESSRHYPYRPVNGRYQDLPAMAAATVLPPSSHYQSSSSFASGYPQQPSNMMMSPESRRPSNETDSSARQSLPPLSEVISGTRPGQYLRPTLQPASSLNLPYCPAPRPYPEADRHPSPHASSAFPHRQEPIPPFSDSPRLPYAGRPGLPLIADQHATPPTKHEALAPHHIAESHQPPEPHPVNGNYSHHPPSTLPPVPYQPGQLPPGQQPLPPYQRSPHHALPHGHSPYGSRAPTHRHEEQEYVSHPHPHPHPHPRSRYEPTPRPFESWNYQEALGRIGTCSRTVFNFAEAYGRIAGEQHGAQPIPERLPTDREVSDMLSNVEYLKRSLEQVREIILATIQSERAREGAKNKGVFGEDPDVHMYSDTAKPHYITEVKKRRGRAAPPGRCHSCNRIDTPEWRRGPDGARTLCNACGLHYAKLERKRQLEARSLRPKPDERG